MRRELWGDDIHVRYDDALNHRIKDLRAALGDDLARPRFIQTVPKVGYRFVAEVTEAGNDSFADDVRNEDEVRGRDIAIAKAIPTNDGAPRRKNLTPPLLRGMGVVLLSTAAIALWFAATIPEAPRVTAVTQLTHFGLATAVVTDGSRLFIEQENGGSDSIVEAPISGAADPVPVPTPFRNVELLDISPDKKWLLISSFEHWGDPGQLWKLPIAGGTPKRVGSYFAESGRWSPDGTRIAFSGRTTRRDPADAIYMINSDGSGLRKLANSGGQIDNWSPDGKRLSVTEVNPVTGGMSLWDLELHGANPQPLLLKQQIPGARWGEGACCGIWAPRARYFIYQETSLPKVSLYAVREHEPVLHFEHKVSELYAAGFKLAGYSAPVFTHNGRQILVVGHNDTSEVARYDVRQHQFVPLLSGLAAKFLSWSPDRKWIAYVSERDMTLWKARADGTGRVQLTFPPLQAFQMVWSPDGKRIAVHILEPGMPGKIAIISVDGGRPEVLFANDTASAQDAPNWSPDGRRLMFCNTRIDEDGKASGSDISILDLSSRHAVQLPGSDTIGPPIWSPDGRYVAAQSADFRRLLLFDFRTGKWTTLSTTASYIYFPHWAHDGRSIYYQDARANEEQPIYRVSLPEGRVQQIASRREILQPNVADYRFIALTPNDDPVVAVVQRNGDVYALDVNLP